LEQGRGGEQVYGHLLRKLVCTTIDCSIVKRPKAATTLSQLSRHPQRSTLPSPDTSRQSSSSSSRTWPMFSSSPAAPTPQRPRKSWPTSLPPKPSSPALAGGCLHVPCRGFARAHDAGGPEASQPARSGRTSTCSLPCDHVAAGRSRSSHALAASLLSSPRRRWPPCVLSVRVPRRLHVCAGLGVCLAATLLEHSWIFSSPQGLDNMVGIHPRGQAGVFAEVRPLASAQDTLLRRRRMGA